MKLAASNRNIREDTTTARHNLVLNRLRLPTLQPLQGRQSRTFTIQRFCQLFFGLSIATEPHYAPKDTSNCHSNVFSLNLQPQSCVTRMIPVCYSQFYERIKLYLLCSCLAPSGQKLHSVFVSFSAVEGWRYSSSSAISSSGMYSSNESSSTIYNLTTLSVKL